MLSIQRSRKQPAGKCVARGAAGAFSPQTRTKANVTHSDAPTDVLKPQHRNRLKRFSLPFVFALEEQEAARVGNEAPRSPEVPEASPAHVRLDVLLPSPAHCLGSFPSPGPSAPGPASQPPPLSGWEESARRPPKAAVSPGRLLPAQPITLASCWPPSGPDEMVATVHLETSFSGGGLLQENF